MATHLCKRTLGSLILIASIVLFAFPLWPMTVLAFEAGFLTGVFLYSGNKIQESRNQNV